ncbi:MAG: HK97 gp10 family phage protein, partial [Ottowia sp.]|nr:HK97 gp10 family phage protein [Ottowia sp.]
AIQTQLKNTLPQAAIAGAEVMKQEISSRAPEHTGQLKASLITQSTHRKASIIATVEIAHSAQEDTEHYAIFQEFGTSKMPARFFFRPGIEAAKPKIKTVMAQAFLAALANHVD